MSEMSYIVQDTQTGEKFVWDLPRVLEEINDKRDRSAEWSPYDATDWTEGWCEFVSGLTIVGFVNKTR